MWKDSLRGRENISARLDDANKGQLLIFNNELSFTILSLLTIATSTAVTQCRNDGTSPKGDRTRPRVFVFGMMTLSLALLHREYSFSFLLLNVDAMLSITSDGPRVGSLTSVRRISDLNQHTWYGHLPTLPKHSMI
jgi:hypothetical protein